MKRTRLHLLFKSRCAHVLGVSLFAVASTAGAQSTVSLGGRMDLSLQNLDGGNVSKTGLDSGVYTASRLIFKATEDLGSGLGALVYLEHRFNADVGAPQSATKFWNAGSYVGLSSSSLGTVTLGRQYVPIFWSFLFADDTGPLRLHGYSAVQSIQRSNFARIAAEQASTRQTGSLDSIANGIYSLGSTSAYEDNLVVYKSPSFSGLSVMLAGGFPEGYATGAGKVWGGNVEYRQGPFYGSVAYNQKEGRVPAGGELRQKMRESLVSSMYELTPELKLWGNFHSWRLSAPANAELKGRDWMLGASYRFQNSMLWLNYAQKKIRNCESCQSAGIGVGYHYFLSKRTELYTSYGYVDNEANAANTLNGFAPGQLGRAVRGIAIGVAHVF